MVKLSHETKSKGCIPFKYFFVLILCIVFHLEIIVDADKDVIQTGPQRYGTRGTDQYFFIELLFFILQLDSCVYAFKKIFFGHLLLNHV